MCTATWKVGPASATLAFNRDERKDRPRALVPRVIEDGALKKLAPIDPQAKGTWIAANECGLCCFLLNNYEANEEAPALDAPSSRGVLPLLLTESRGLAVAAHILGELDLACYRPFHLGLISLDGIALYSWDGSRLSERDASSGLLTTSSFRSKDVQGYREKRFAQTLGAIENPSYLERRGFHVELENPDRAFNPFMLRDESETHNVCSVEIDPKEIVFRYEERVSETFELSAPVISRLSCI